MQAQTKLTSQGQVLVPAAFRNLLGLTPGCAAPAPAKTLKELKQGIRQHMQRRHAGA